MTTPDSPWGPPPGPPPQTPPGWQPPQYGAPPPGYYGAPRTNTFAIVSLVFGCVQPLLCGIGAIAAIVTGHLALSQIKRTEEQGKRLAIAGLILGYVGLVAVIGFVVLFAFALADSQNELREDAREFQLDVNLARIEAEIFVSRLEDEVRDPNTTLRDPAAIRKAASSAQYSAHVFELPDLTPLDRATRDDFERNDWQIQVRTNTLRSLPACITIPARATSDPIIEGGLC